jgi:hypothetical protein
MALETDVLRLFRLTSSLLANRLPAQAAVARTLQAGAAVPINRRIRIMRVSPHVDPRAALQVERPMTPALYKSVASP